MFKGAVRTVPDALAYITDCTLATVGHMATTKSRKKSEFLRQVSIAQIAVDWMRQMGVPVESTRAAEVIKDGGNVLAWAKKYMPEQDPMRSLEQR